MKVATMLIAKEITIECPYCNKTTDGYIGDPRSEQVDCEWCGKTFEIHQDADIEIL